MPTQEAPSEELGSAPQSVVASPSPSELSSASSPEPQNIRPTPLFRALALPPPQPLQPPGQDELERRLPGYRRIVIPRELTLIELLKQSSGVSNDDEVLHIREARLRVVAERVGLRRLHILAPHLRSLTLDGSGLSSLRELGIGLVHLKILSINRCGLTSLDGVWGLGALRELYAAGNRLQDLQPLAALQKLHTLNLADNPIGDAGRLWTLAVCGSLRSLTLRGTPASNSPDYHSLVVSSLPTLMYLDDQLLHPDIDDESDEMFGQAVGRSDSEDEPELLPIATQPTPPPAEPEPGPSTEYQRILEQGASEGDGDVELETRLRPRRRRPATTECAGERPPRPAVLPRPRTAHSGPVTNAPPRLQILNTLMDEEWRCSGSKLTSHGAVCGNLARALRRPTSATAYRPHVDSESYTLDRGKIQEMEAEKEHVAETMQDAIRAVAAEIPRAPRLEDWAKFTQETGIDIQIDFHERPTGDPLAAIERLERIEKETCERLAQEKSVDMRIGSAVADSATRFGCAVTIMSDYELWPGMDVLAPSDPPDNVDVGALFNNISVIRSVESLAGTAD